MTPRDIEFRIQNLFDGKPAPDERDALLAEIGCDPHLFDIYWGYVVLDCAFARLSRSGAFLRGEQAVITATDLLGRRKLRFRWSLAAAAAVLALLAVSLHLIFVHDPPPTVTLRLSPGSAFNVSHAMVKEGSAPPGTLMPGSRAKLDQGTVELTFESGVRSIVMGPAELTLHDGGILFLQSGTAWFEVPAKAVGFKVQTPAMTVTDLGTVFGVRSRKDLPPEVHVFRGKVEVQTHGRFSATATLGAGTARAAGLLGHMSEIPAAPEHFLTALPDSLPHLHWSFDQTDARGDARGSLPAVRSGVGHMAGLENAKAFGATGGRFGRALLANGAVGEAASDWTGISGNAPRTVAHWIKLPPNELHSQVIVGWGSHNLNPFNWNPAFLTYLRRTGPGTVAGVSFGACYLNGTTPIDDDRWHHFAVVYSGRTGPDGNPELQCYLDGRPEPMILKFRLPPDTARGSALAIDTSPAVQGTIPVTLFPVGWDGPRSRHISLAIDELYIFEAALAEEQIRNLYRHNQYDYGRTQ